MGLRWVARALFSCHSQPPPLMSARTFTRSAHCASATIGSHLRWVSPGGTVHLARCLCLQSSSQDPPPTAILYPIYLPTAILTSLTGVATTEVCLSSCTLFTGLPCWVFSPLSEGMSHNRPSAGPSHLRHAGHIVPAAAAPAYLPARSSVCRGGPRLKRRLDFAG